MPSVRQRFAKWLTKGVAQIASSTGFWTDSWQTSHKPTRHELLRAYAGTVYACANINAKAVASATLRLYATQRSGEAAPRCLCKKLTGQQRKQLAGRQHLVKKVSASTEVYEVLDHPLLDLLNHVNDVMDTYSLFEMTDLHQELLGDAYWAVTRRNPLNVPDTIWILLPNLVTISRDQATGLVTEYVYGNGMFTERFTPDEVIHFKFPNPEDPYGKGRSPVEAAWRSHEIMEKIKSRDTATMDNRARPDFLVTMEDGLGLDESEQIERKLNRKLMRRGNGGILVMDGKSTVTPLNFMAKDLERLGIYDVTKIELANAYDVPISKLETKNVNKANAQAGNYQLAHDATLPRLKRMEQRLNHRFCPMFDERLFVAYDNPVNEDREQQLQVRESELRTGTLTINEVRYEEGREPVAWGDEPWIPGSLSQPSSEARKPVKPTLPVDAIADGNDDPANTGDEDEAQEAGMGSPKSVRRPFAILADLACKEITREVAVVRLVDCGVSQVEAARFTNFKQLPNPYSTCGCGKPHKRGKVNQLWVAPKLKQAVALEQVLRQHFHSQLVYVLGVVQKGYAKRWDTPIDLSKFLKSLADRATPLIQLEWEAAANELLARVGVTDASAVWNVQDARVREMIQEAVMQFCQETNDTTTLQLDMARQQVRDLLGDAMSSADLNTVAEMTNRVQAVFDQAETWRAQRIAVTESSRAVHMAQIDSAKASNVVAKMKWLASDDACEACLKLNNEERSPGEPFAIESDDPNYGTVYGPPDHPSCQCTLTEVLKDGEGA